MSDNPYQSPQHSGASAGAEPESTQARRAPRFRLRIVPAALLAVLGFVSSAWGLYGLGHNLWSMGTGAGTVAPFEFLFLTVLGVTWIISAVVLMNGRWLLALFIASIVFATYRVAMEL